MAVDSVTALQEERRLACEELSRSLEAISMKDLLDFKSRSEVPRPVQSVAVASVCMVAQIDDLVEVGADGLPPRTWEAAQLNMAKPGLFVNALRQFSYAVDSGRLPDLNVAAARQCLEDVSPEHLVNEQMALRLHEWICAAWRYCEVVQHLRLRNAVGGTQQAGLGQAPPSMSSSAVAGGRMDSGSPGSRSTPPSSPEQVSYQMGYMGAEASGETPGNQMRLSMGSSVGGSNSVFGRSPVAGTSPGGSQRSSGQSRPSGGGVGGGGQAGGARGVTTRRPNAAPPTAYAPRRSQDSTASSTLRVTPSGSPASTRSPGSRASPSQPSAPLPRRRPGADIGSVGYPRGPRSNVGIEDWQQKLEQMRREVRQYKEMEAKHKWAMKREEEAQKKNDAREDMLEVMSWRQERNKGLAEYAAERNAENKFTNLKESKEYQDFKRNVKQEEKKNEEKLMRDNYAETKDYSEWEVELKRIIPQEERQLIVDANLEKYTVLATHNDEEAKREKLEQKIARDEAEEAEMSYQMLQVKMERDEALQSLEFFRNQQTIAPSAGEHIPSRPFATIRNPL